MAESALPIATLSDVNATFTPMRVDEPEPVRIVRGTTLAMAQDWVKGIPAGPKRELALHHLREAARLACEALYPASASS